MTAQPPVDIVAAVRAELATPGRYHLGPARTHQSVLGEIWRWIAAHWHAFWANLMRHFPVSRSGATLIGDAVVILCMLAVVFAVVQLLIRLELESAQHAPSVPLRAPRNAQAFAIAAAQAAAGGDYTRAVRLLFIAAVTLLDLRGVVRDERGATVNELRREVRERDARLEPPFVTLARTYTSAAYAEEPLGEDAWTRAQDAYAQLRAHAGA